MSAAKKDLPPPAGNNLGDAMRRRYRHDAEDETETSEVIEPVTPVRREVVKPIRREAVTSRRSAPAAAASVAWTIRYDPVESMEIDEWLLELRRELGRSRLDKSEVVRALVQAARQEPRVRRILLDILTT